MMIYSLYGGVEMAEVDALTNCHNFPQQWTRKPWIRPDGRPDVPIPPDWEQMGLLARIGLARTTVVDRGTEIETVAQADQAISTYLAGTQHPNDKAGSA
jgi:hypothetical protein